MRLLNLIPWIPLLLCMSLKANAFGFAANYDCTLKEAGSSGKINTHIPDSLKLNLKDSNKMSLSSDKKGAVFSCKGNLEKDRRYPFRDYLFGTIEGRDCGWDGFGGHASVSEIGANQSRFFLHIQIGFTGTLYDCKKMDETFFGISATYWQSCSHALVGIR
jgi:hypothetical protein